MAPAIGATAADVEDGGGVAGPHRARERGNQSQRWARARRPRALASRPWREPREAGGGGAGVVGEERRWQEWTRHTAPCSLVLLTVAEGLQSAGSRGSRVSVELGFLEFSRALLSEQRGRGWPGGAVMVVCVLRGPGVPLI